jgi:hypothetical protein
LFFLKTQKHRSCVGPQKVLLKTFSYLQAWSVLATAQVCRPFFTRVDALFGMGSTLNDAAPQPPPPATARGPLPPPPYPGAAASGGAAAASLPAAAAAAANAAALLSGAPPPDFASVVQDAQAAVSAAAAADARARPASLMGGLAKKVASKLSSAEMKGLVQMAERIKRLEAALGHAVEVRSSRANPLPLKTTPAPIPPPSTPYTHINPSLPSGHLFFSTYLFEYAERKICVANIYIYIYVCIVRRQNRGKPLDPFAQTAHAGDHQVKDDLDAKLGSAEAVKEFLVDKLKDTELVLKNTIDGANEAARQHHGACPPPPLGLLALLVGFLFRSSVRCLHSVRSLQRVHMGCLALKRVHTHHRVLFLSRVCVLVCCECAFEADQEVINFLDGRVVELEQQHAAAAATAAAEKRETAHREAAAAQQVRSLEEMLEWQRAQATAAARDAGAQKRVLVKEVKKLRAALGQLAQDRDAYKRQANALLARGKK